MSRNPQLELIQARFEWQTCAEEHRNLMKLAYERLIAQALQANRGAATREELEEALREPYRHFKRARLLEQRAKLSRLR